MISDEVKAFCKHYAAIVKPTNDRMISTPYIAPYNRYGTDTAMSQVDFRVEHVTCVQIIMSEYSFKHLVHIDEFISNIHDSTINEIIDRERVENLARTKNSAVAKAYRTYKLLLEMTRREYE